MNSFLDSVLREGFEKLSSITFDTEDSGTAASRLRIKEYLARTLVETLRDLSMTRGHFEESARQLITSVRKRELNILCERLDTLWQHWKGRWHYVYLT